MKRKTLPSLFLILSFFGGSSATDLCGMLYMPTTLSKDKSPYRITGDIYVPPASRLTIEAGVELLVAAKDSCDQDLQQLDWSDSQFVSIKVDGNFYVKGTPKNPVIIRPEKPATGKIQWDGLRIRKQDEETAVIKFLQLSGANRGLQIDHSVFSIQNSFFVENNTGIWLGERANVSITNNLFSQNTSAGIYLQYSAPLVVANIFYQNPTYAIWADSRKGIKIKSNVFFGSGEQDCWHCPLDIGKHASVNANGDSTDQFDNIFADPAFENSLAEAKKKHLDKFVPTSENTVSDKNLQAVHNKADSLGKAGLPPKPVFQAQGIGAWRISKYSPALDAAPDQEKYQDANGTRGDIGPWGATMKYEIKEP